MVNLDAADDVLVTGGCGFIGSHVVNMLHRKYPHIKITNIDKLTYAADESRVDITDGMYDLVVGDIADFELVKRTVETTRPSLIIHLAAESHVDQSLVLAGEFVKSNVLGTVSILEAIKHTTIPLVYVSTDEVYGEVPSGSAVETDSLLPRNPYSASKAGAEHFVRSYANTFGVRSVITRGSNTYGVGQHSEKFIPTAVRSMAAGLPVPVYGDGQQIREWTLATDHASGIIAAATRGSANACYNLGSGNRVSNMDVIRQLEGLGQNLGAWKAAWVQHVQDRPGHDARYALDSGRARREIGWAPIESTSAAGSPLNEEVLLEIIRNVVSKPGILNTQSPR